MFIIIGLIVLIGAVVVGVAGIAANSGENHLIPGGFTVFEHTYAGSSGLLFAYGILIGAIGTCGLIMLLAGTWATSRRGVAARRDLRNSRREMAAARRELTTKPVPEPQPPKRSALPADPKKAAAAAPSQPIWSFNRFMNRSTPAKPATSLSKSK
ncbi:hypothetical protein [Nocardia sp. NBC_01388]|uniref:hypothetical protein n=1 Tax=Nocardia sp. NBC_01388 TaxID=2903596 RepID=UPI00324F9BBE